MSNSSATSRLYSMEIDFYSSVMMEVIYVSNVQ